MAKIELDLTVTEARKLLKTLDAATAADPVLADLYHHLKGALDLIDSAPKAPWRKVVGRDRRGVHTFEKLECGHSYMLRSSKNWEEGDASRRRCRQCAGLPSRYA